MPHWWSSNPSASACFADAVLAVAWSPVQPDLVATGGQDDKAYIWRVRDALIPHTAQHAHE